MAKVFLVIALVLLAAGVLEAKRTDKNVKKAFSAKPTKTPKSVVDQFAGLPEEDVKFIKELDKQFKLHGDKIKIRIERDNSSAQTGKNSKRGLDGEIGYGYHRNHRPQSNFYFSKPKLEFYPYSQEDIPPLPHVAQQQLHQQQLQQQLHHRNRQRLNFHARPHYTHVEIQPSPGYEIKETTFDHPPPPPQPYHADYQQYQQQDVYQAEPVIVLKIPGPQKYAAHLKVLLQQYIELRAAQYLQELQQQEEASQHGNVVQETYVEEHVPETNGHTLATAQTGTPHDVYGPPQHQAHEAGGYVQHEHQDVPVSDEMTVYEEPQQGQAVYETHEVHYAPQQAVFINQNLYQEEARSAYQAPPYLPAPDQPAEQQQYYYQQPEQHQHHHGDEDLPTSENYPSEHHTRVIFTKELHQSATPSTHVEYQQEYHTPAEVHSTATPAAFRAQEYYQPHEMEVDDVVAITQKPYNYHAHVSSSTTLGPSKSAKRDAPPYTEEQFKKLSKLVHKLKRKQEQ